MSGDRLAHIEGWARKELDRMDAELDKPIRSLMGVPARRPEDDALDRLEATLRDPREIAVVREALERLREAMENGDRLLSQAGRQLEAAEAEVRRLTATPPLTRITELEAINAQLARQVRRLTEGLRERDALLRQMLEHMEFAHYPQTNDGPHLADPFDLMDKARALLSASPSDGPDDFCEHGYTTENAAHPSAGLERCPTCSPSDGGGA